MGERSPKPVCISHNRDVDGIVTAALVRHAGNCELLFTDYDNLVQTLQTVEDTTYLYICDLGTNNQTEFQFLQQLRRIARRAGICYIDHHPMHQALMQKLTDIGVKLIHSTSDCAAAITYDLYKDKLPRDAALLAASAALTDRIEDGPVAKKVLKRYDRDLVMLEASILSYAIAAKGDDNEFLLDLTHQLANFKMPHQIPNLWRYASEYGQRMIDLGNRIRLEGVRMKNMAYMETTERNLGSVANSVAGEFDVPVGVAYRYKQDTGDYIVSLRSRDDFLGDLGELTSSTASLVEGIGGGHPNASGAVIPSKNILKFLGLLDESLALVNSKAI